MALTLNDLTNPKYGDFNECFALIMEDEQCQTQLQSILAVGIHHLGADSSERFKGDIAVPAVALVKRMLDMAYAYCGEDQDEPRMCRECAGSGIGKGDPDRSRCHACNGSGVEPKQS